MRAPVLLVALTLTVAILVAASLLIFTGTRRTSGHSTLNPPSAAARTWMNA